MSNSARSIGKDRVPTLASLAQSLIEADFESPDTKNLGFTPPQFVASLDEIATIELGKLTARGRIEKVVTSRGRTHGVVNMGGEIDNARLLTYDKESNTIILRMDRSTHQEFWAEVYIPVEQLRNWLAAEKRLMGIPSLNDQGQEQEQE